MKITNLIVRTSDRYILEVCSTFVTELVVLVLTWKTTARALKVLSQKDIALPLTRLLLRDVRTVGNLGASLSWTSHDAAQNDHWDDPKEDFPHVSNDPLLTTLVWDSLADGSMIREDLDKNMEVTESGCEKMAV
ncbi:hypothetical protein PHLCEN_2v2984 [Hermanssonia centrifuga]|uniref:Uncharacterized protein n=1 Tax=Hermanssonia centrifuga TaxID=98765 RepID=A0A2R6R7F4_9APHY|nr:hypothetical protein PHLCEN_2v2984 [Hermanssonia centrifuga]